MDEVNTDYLSQGTPNKSPGDLFQLYSDKAIRRPEQQQRFFSGSKQKTEPQTQGSGVKQPEVMQMQLIAFYEQNLQNLKQMVLEKDEELKIREEKILEQNMLVIFMNNSFNKIIQILQEEKEELLEKYMQAMDEIQTLTQKQQQQQSSQQQQLLMVQQKMQQQLQFQFQQMKSYQPPTDYDSKLIELHEAKQQIINHKNQCINLEVKVKESEVKLEDSNLRLNEAYMRIDLLEKETHNLMQQNSMLDKQFKSLLQQFEQYQMIQKKQSQQSQYREAASMMNSTYSSSSNVNEQQILQNVNQNSLKQNEQTQENDSLINTYTQFKKQNSLKQFNQMLVQSQCKQNGKQDTLPAQANYGGIMNFPSEFRTQQQKDLELQLTNSLNDLVNKKQTIESELNKKINISKSALERRKREQLELELDMVQDQINKVKLKLRENKFI